MTRYLLVFIIVLIVGLAGANLTQAQDAAYPLPGDLYYLALDDQGIAQVWQITDTQRQPRALTAEPVAVQSYSVAPERGKLAYITQNTLIITQLDGSTRQEFDYFLPTENSSELAWDHTGTRLVWRDDRGLWLLLAQTSYPPILITSHYRPTEYRAMGQYYSHPSWSPDDTRLLITVGRWEWSGKAIITLDQMTLGIIGGDGHGHWLPGGGVFVSDYRGYGNPPPLALLILPTTGWVELLPYEENIADRHLPIADITIAPDGTVYIVSPPYASESNTLRVETASTLGEPFELLFWTEVPGANARFLPGIDPPVIAALQNATPLRYQPGDQGDPVLIDVSTEQIIPIPANGPIWAEQWIITGP